MNPYQSDNTKMIRATHGWNIVATLLTLLGAVWTLGFMWMALHAGNAFTACLLMGVTILGAQGIFRLASAAENKALDIFMAWQHNDEPRPAHIQAAWEKLCRESDSNPQR